MKKKLKEIIEKAKHKDHGMFDEFLIIPTGKKYDGFWGVNGFDKMTILAKQKSENEFCILTNWSDSFHLIRVNTVNFDIPSDLNCIRIFTDEPVEITDALSSILGYGGEDVTN